MFNAAIANGAGVDLTAAEKIKLEDELLLSSLETDKTKFAEFFNEVEIWDVKYAEPVNII